MRDDINTRNALEILQAARQDSRRKIVSRLLETVCKIAVIVGLLNFLMFAAGTFYFGGDAINGKVEAGRYYLWGYHDGLKGYIEVNKAVFDYSRWHVYSVFITWSFMLIAAFAWKRLQQLRRE